MSTQPTWQNPLSVAPMMQRTDRHFRYMMRCISKHTLLYTEMVTARAIIHGDRPHLLDYNVQEHPLVLQIGGDDPNETALAAKIAVEDYGYDEVNLNVGCPSDRVQNGNFGACLMAQPERVRDCVIAMSEAVDAPITVKHRIGIDDIDQYEDMLRFVDIVASSGQCKRFTVHARKAWLQGLSPKENRNIPPLRYPEVYQLKAARPELKIEINGGIKTMAQTQAHLQHVDAVMIGRAAYDTPYIFAEADHLIYRDTSHPIPTRHEIVEAMLPYIDAQVSAGQKLHRISRHLINLFAGQPGAKQWRRYISERHHLDTAGVEVVEEALKNVPHPNDHDPETGEIQKVG